MCYECEISVSVHNSYHEVEAELESLSFNKETIDEILIGDTYNDWVKKLLKLTEVLRSLI